MRTALANAPTHSHPTNERLEWEVSVRRIRQLALFLLIALPVLAADLAVLRNGHSIRHRRREVTGDVTRLYLTAEGYVDVPTAEIIRIETEEYVPTPEPPPSAARPIPQLIDEASDRHQLDADFVRSVVRAESAFNPRALSPKGAQGLMQLMPATASDLGVANPFDPAANVEGGVRHLRALLRLYGNDPAKALAAYNAGTERVTRYGGIPPYRETRAYVAQVIRDFNRQKTAQKRNASGAASKASGGTASLAPR